MITQGRIAAVKRMAALVDRVVSINGMSTIQGNVLIERMIAVDGMKAID